MRPELLKRIRWTGVGLGVASLLIFQIAVFFPHAVEGLYVPLLGWLFPNVLSRLTGWIPFSLGEICILLFLVRQVIGSIRGLSDARRGIRTMKQTAGAGVLRLGSDLGFALCLFYLIWGFSYARPAMEVRLGWEGRDAGVEELVELASEQVRAVNAEYLALHGVEDLGSATMAPPDRVPLMKSLESGWVAASELIGEPGRPSGYGPPKPSLASGLLNYLGIAGFYFPWTGEANFNNGVPPESLPRVIGHEMAHQRGYAREDEANFMGYLVNALSNDPYSRYSAAQFAQRQLIGAVAARDVSRARELSAGRLPGVQRDIDASNAYRAQFAGPARLAAQFMNNAYLRSQKVPGGIQSYGRSVRLLIEFSRRRNLDAIQESSE
jgi:hypothetical protein